MASTCPTPIEMHAIVNPAAANGRAGRCWPQIAQQLRSHSLIIHEHFTTAPGQAGYIARDLAQQESIEVLAVGGDGTINEVVDGLLGGGAAHSTSARLSVLPLGTGRDFARGLGIRNVSNAIAAIANCGVADIDVGAITVESANQRTRRCFINVADIGLGAKVAARVNHSSKALGGLMTYLIGALREMASLRCWNAAITVDGQCIHAGPLNMIVIANGRYYGGGMVPAPKASLVDGLFDVVMLGNTSKAAMTLNLLPRVYWGAHLQHKAIRTLRCKRIEVRVENPQTLAMDGETCAFIAFEATVLPAALQVRVPLEE